MAKVQSKSYPQCPKYDGVAVCVDCSPLKTYKDPASGESFDTFHYVFEVPIKDDEGNRYRVKSKNFTMSYGEKSNLKKFLVEWMGRTMTKKEVDAWDNENEVGKLARISARQVPSKKDESKIYAEIKLIEPTDEKFEADGTYVREKDRKQGAGAGGDAQHHRTPELKETSDESVMRNKMHEGPYAGQEFADLSTEQLQKIWDKWMPWARKQPKLSADAKRTVAAMEYWNANKDKADEAGGEGAVSDTDWNG